MLKGYERTKRMGGNATGVFGIATGSFGSATGI
jgi:hypothetical protein